MQSYLLVLKENRYSFSPIISIVDFYSSNIEIIYLKDFSLKENQYYSENILIPYIENQLKDLKVSDDINFFFFSIHSWYRKFFLIVLNILRKRYPDSIYIAGGPDVIAQPFLYADFFDLICKGEGESFLIDFFNQINLNKNKVKIEIYPENISNCISKNNIIYISRENNKIKILRKKTVECIYGKANEIKIYKDFLVKFYSRFSSTLFTENPMEFQLVINKIDSITKLDEIFNYFPSFPMISSFFHPIEIVRGCPQGCKYCQVSNIFGRKPRKKSIEIVKTFLKYQLKYKKNHIRFISPDFALYFNDNETSDFIHNWESLIDFIKDEGKKLNLETFIYLGSFPSELSLRFLKLEYLNLINKFSATKKITIGIQTYSQKLQKIIGRNDPLENLEETLSICSDMNIEPIIDIILGLPYEDEEDRDITLSFLEKNCKDKISANLHFFLPIPGTAFENNLPEKLSLKEISRINKLISRANVSGNFFKQMNEFNSRLEIPTHYLQNL